MTTPLRLLADTTRVEEQFELARWSSGNALIVGATVSIILFFAVRWLYRHEGRGALSKRSRIILTTIRCLILLLLGLIGLEPVLVKYVHRKVDACTIVLIDESASMGVADRYRSADTVRRVSTVLGSRPETSAGLPRTQLVERVADGAWLADLARHNHVRVFGFGDTLRPLADIPPGAITQPAAALNLNPTGAATNLGQAVRAAVESLGGAPVAAVVLISDGNINDGDTPEAIGQFLAARRIPLEAIGAGDPSEPVNVRVVEVTAPRMVFKTDPFQITAFLASTGLGDLPIDVELVSKNADGSEGRVLARKSVRARPDGQIDPVIFEQRVNKPGDHTYVVRVPAVDDESIDSDNRRETLPAVRVLDDKMRVLLVGGAPSFDYRFLARVLSRERSVDVSCWLQSADDRAVREGTTIIDHLPSKSEELLKYDAIILIDPDPKMLPVGWGSLAASLVTDYGGGILYEAGRKYAGDFFRNPKTAPLVEILPVVRDPDAELLLNDLGIYQRRSWPLIIPDASAANPILRMSDDPQTNRSVWSLLEGAFWHYPVRREKPAATVLLRHSNPRMVNSNGPHILMASQFVGAGRTVFLGFDGTWRWRRVGEAFFNRFWVQTLRYLVEGKLAGSRNQIMLLTDRDRFQPGEPVVVTARLLDEKFQPIKTPASELTVVGPENRTRTVALEPIENRPGYYQGRFIADQVGAFRLSVSLPQRGNDAPRAQREIVVAPSDVELTNPILRRPTLKALAEQTGGRYFEIDEARSVPEFVEDRSQTVVVRERPRPLWDNAYVLAALVGLLCIEWFVRRNVNLL